MFKDFFNKKNKNRIISLTIVILLYLFIFILNSTGNISSLLKSLLVPLTCYIVAALSLNLVVGISGELSLGQAGFMSIGSFSAILISAYLSSIIPNEILRLIISMLIGGIIAGIIGYLISIPVLKLSGDYLAIVTLAFGEIIKSLINNMYVGLDNNGLHFSIIENKLNLQADGKMLLNGPMGAIGNQRIANYHIGFILIIITIILIFNLIDSRDGRAMLATRDNKIAPLSSGVNTTQIKTLAFVFAAFLTGMAGALYGLNYATVTASKFDFNTSIMILVYVVLGGLSNIPGTIIATTILVILPDMMRSLKDYRMIIYSLALILMMLIKNNEKLNDYFNKLKSSIFKKEGIKNV